MLDIELQRLSSKQYPPSGPNLLIQLAIRTNKQIRDDLSVLLDTQNDNGGIPDREVEINLRAKASLFSFIHLVMQYVEGAEVQFAPSSFVMPLRRLLQKHFRDFDFILRVSRHYNYSVLPLIVGIKDVYENAQYTGLLSDFPDQFFVISCPISERKNIPVHCIFAHEIGHALYKKHGLADLILPSVSVDETVLSRLISTLAMQPVETGVSDTTAGDVFREWRIDQAVRSELREIIWNWVEELASDELALCLLGPAYFFAFVFFGGPFASMDDSSKKHPPDRMRIRFMCEMLSSGTDRLAYDKVLPDPAIEYIEQWKAYANQSYTSTAGSEETLDGIAISSITPALSKIMEETKRATRGSSYTPRRFKRDVPYLCENIANGIPINEIFDDWSSGTPRTAQAEAILNAGWTYMISRDDRYAKLLGVEDQWKVTNRLFDLVSKSLEYSEMQRRWK